MSYNVGECGTLVTVIHPEARHNKYGDANDKPGDKADDSAADHAYDKAEDALESIGLSLCFNRPCSCE